MAAAAAAAAAALPQMNPDAPWYLLRHRWLIVYSHPHYLISTIGHLKAAANANSNSKEEEYDEEEEGRRVHCGACEPHPWVTRTAGDSLVSPQSPAQPGSTRRRRHHDDKRCRKWRWKRD
jgi:hypothetical protein